MANKVKFGLSNVYYAPMDETLETYSTPVAMPGAVSLSFDSEGDTNKFRADNVDYYVSISNNGYSGELELALIPDSFLTTIMGEVVDTDGIQYELANVQPKPFALLFQFEGDDKATRHVFYNCKAERPGKGSETTDETIEPGTESLSITASPRTTDNVVKGKAEYSAAAYANWFTSVQTPTI